MYETKKERSEYARLWRRRKKQERIAELGGKCEVCGISEIEMLSISGGKVLCHNHRESLQVKKVGKKNTIKQRKNATRKGK